MNGNNVSLKINYNSGIYLPVFRQTLNLIYKVSTPYWRDVKI